LHELEPNDYLLNGIRLVALYDIW